MSLESSAASLAERLKAEYRTLLENEDTARSSKPTGLEIATFRDLSCQVSLLVIRTIETEWLNLTDPERGYLTEPDANCNCRARLRLSLPCRHLLLPVFKRREPIPLSLVHPRWWLAGPVAARGWKPTYGGRLLIISPKKTVIYATFDKIL